MLDVCTSWHAAIDADPLLWPTAVLRARALKLEPIEEPGSSDAGPCEALTALKLNDERQLTALDAAAALSPRLRRLRLEGFAHQARTSLNRCTDLLDPCIATHLHRPASCLAPADGAGGGSAGSRASHPAGAA